MDDCTGRPGSQHRRKHRPHPGPLRHQILLADRLTAATSPIAAFAGLAIGLLVLKMTRQQAATSVQEANSASASGLAARPAAVRTFLRSAADSAPAPHVAQLATNPGEDDGESTCNPDPGLLRDASAIYQRAAARGERLSQRTLAQQLCRHGHRFPNEHLRAIAERIGLAAGKAA